MFLKRFKQKPYYSMDYGYRGCILFILFLCLVSFDLFSFDIPRLGSWVNDYAGVLDPQIKLKLDQKLEEFEKRTTNQVFVLIVPTLGDAGSIENYSIKVAEAWKAGQKKKDNGVILVLAMQERRLRIEVGYGLEGVLPDITAGRIINNVMKPFLKNGDYNGAVSMGVEAIIKVIETGGKLQGDPYAETENEIHGKSGRVINNVIHNASIMKLVPFFLFVLIPVIGIFKNKILRSLIGGGVFSVFGLLFFGTLFGLLLAFIIGALFSLISSFSGSVGRRRGPWVGGFGGFSGGGWSGGGSSFGGGGGGGFGGGGSSGSW